MGMAKAVELIAQKSSVALNYTEQFKKHIDPSDPSAESKMAYLSGVALLFSQMMALSHADDFAKTLSILMQDQIVLAKRMSFFGGITHAAVAVSETTKPPM